MFSLKENQMRTTNDEYLVIWGDPATIEKVADGVGFVKLRPGKRDILRIQRMGYMWRRLVLVDLFCTSQTTDDSTSISR
jgi:hypothetical protein